MEDMEEAQLLDNQMLDQHSDADYLLDHMEVIEDVDHKIALERHNSLIELEQNINDIGYIQTELAKFVYLQGESIDEVAENIETAERETSEGVTNLEQAAEYVKDKFIILRDISIVTAGGLLGAAGLFAGPLIGAGTIVAGVSAGGAAVAGIHKMSK